MAICANCGAALAEGAVFCDQCGSKVISSGSESNAAASSGSDTREEGIRLADYLALKYDTLEKLKNEINDIEFNIKKIQVSPEPPRYSVFRFFWPFFIIALGVCFFVTLIASIVAANSSYPNVGMVFAEILGYLSIPVVLIIGLFVAKARRNAANEELAAKEMTLTRKADDLHKKVVELRNQQSQINIELTAYKDMLPASMRNKTQLQKIKRLLEAGKAQSFAEAVEQMKHPGSAKA